MKRSPLILIFLFFSIISLLPAIQKIKEKDLAEKYQDWLINTRYIIIEQEKDVFMQLTNDRDRNLFIETFWKQRDPTPGTPRNEYKEEHFERFTYVNTKLRHGSPRAGWMTDMGRIYIILGRPISIDRYEGTKGIYPTQVWSYYGDPEKGLLTHFSLVFFQRGGSGEYKLYNPVSDGPSSLLVHSLNMDPFDYETLYAKFLEIAPTLAPVTLSIIPGEIPFNYQPSTQNAIYMASILESPKKRISPTYATHFLNYKGIVTTEYLTNFVECNAEIYTIQDPMLDINFLHFSVAPKDISIDFYEPNNQYFYTYKLDVNLRAEEDIIFQYSKEFPFYFPKEDLKKIQGNGISIEDSFPIIEGKYKLTILLQNPLGKEFSIVEREINVPEDTGSPHIVGPVLGYKVQNYPLDRHIPFKVLDRKLVFDPTNTFSTSENISVFFTLPNLTQDLWQKGSVNIFIQGLKPNNPAQKSLILRLSNNPFRRTLFVSHTIPPGEFPPDYYRMKLDLIDEKGNIIDEKNSKFVISPKAVIPHPIAHAKAFPLANKFVYFYMLAQQYENVKEYVKAEASFAKAYGMNPNFKKGLTDYANFLLRTQKFNKSLELIEAVKEDENLKFDYYLTRGKAFLGMGNYSDAIDNLLEGNKIYNSDTSLLNSLGLCYYKTGEKELALDVLKASLRLNSQQEGTKKLIEEIEKSRD